MTRLGTIRVATSLLACGAGDFERRDILHGLATTIELVARFFTVTLLNDLNFETAFFTAQHIAGGGVVGMGVTHEGAPFDSG
jgi:hypothetical protein